MWRKTIRNSDLEALPPDAWAACVFSLLMRESSSKGARIMWSLPDLIRLNSEAATNRKHLERAVRTGKLNGKTIPCEQADYDGANCGGSISCELWSDIFSDDPKGILAQCEYHCDRHGMPEGYFYCCACGRTLISNYTWEKFNTLVDGEELCLPCACARYIADQQNWLLLTPEDIAAFDFDQMRRAPHVIGVKMPIPHAIRFLDNAEFDSMDGHQISGDPIQSILDSAGEQGYTKALVVMDAAYQFAVSFGVYVDRDEYFKLNPEEAPKSTKSQQKPARRGRRVALGGVA
jgi:hypothetical protein